MDEKDAVSSFLGEDDAKASIFNEEQVQEEGITTETEEKEEKALPFHRDPKVQRYVDKQIEKALKDRPQSVESQFKRDVEDINLPDSFVQLIGNDTDEKRKVLKDMSDYLSSLPEKAKQEFLKEQQQAERARIEADEKAQEELDDYFEEIEETYGVDLSSNTASAKQTKAQFIEYVRKIAPKDANGEVSAFPDMLGAFEDFQEKSKRPTATRAKELANRGLTRSGDTTVTAPTGRSWKDVDRFLDKLKEN